MLMKFTVAEFRPVIHEPKRHNVHTAKRLIKQTFNFRVKEHMIGRGTLRTILYGNALLFTNIFTPPVLQKSIYFLKPNLPEFSIAHKG